MREGVRKVCLGLRILEGRCVSLNEAKFQNVEEGTRPLLDEDIQEAEKLVLEGLSMLEGTKLLLTLRHDKSIGVHPVNNTI